MAKAEINYPRPITYEFVHLNAQKPHAEEVLIEVVTGKKTGFSWNFRDRLALNAVEAKKVSEINSLPEARVLIAATSPFAAPVGDTSGLDFEGTGDFYNETDKLRIEALYWDTQADRLRKLSDLADYRKKAGSPTYFADKAHDAMNRRDVILMQAQMPMPSKHDLATWILELIKSHPINA